jgi:hypothetical protein
MVLIGGYGLSAREYSKKRDNGEALIVSLKQLIWNLFGNRQSWGRPWGLVMEHHESWALLAFIHNPEYFRYPLEICKELIDTGYDNISVGPIL